MIILELSFEKGWQGGDRQTIYTMLGFRDAGITTHLVCRKGSPLEINAKKEGLITHSFDSVFGVVFFLITKGRKYDFIHAQASQILTYCVFTKLFHGKKVLYTRRINFTQKGFFTKLKYRYTDKIIAISHAIKNTVTAFTHRNDIEYISSIVIKKNIDSSSAKELIASLNIDNKIIIATTSALTPDKDPFMMLAAIKILSGKRSDFVFLHFGKRDLLDAMKAKIKEENLEKVYYMMGFVENVEAFFTFFDVFTMSSKEEGLGSSVLDAFINRVPVVSTNAGGLVDLIKDDRGIFCEIGDPQSMADGIETILNNNLAKEKYINNAFNYVEQYHNMKYLTDKYIDLFKSL